VAERLGITNIDRANHSDALVYAPTMYAAGQGESTVAGATYETRGYDVLCGIARIEVSGTLVAKNGTLRPESGMTGYDGIRRKSGHRDAG
jgi:ClpP class serine protease